MLPIELPITYWHWWALGGLLIIVEAFAPGFMLLWLGVAAVGVGMVLLLWPPVDLSVQLLLFACLSIGSIFAWRRYRVQAPRAVSDQPFLNRRAAQYVGRHAMLVDPIVNGYGRVKIGDTSWAAIGPDLPAGRPVQVVGADGIVLSVAPLARGEDEERGGASPVEVPVDDQDARAQRPSEA